MYCVGLTGSIASGKSTVAAYFKEKNIAVHSADAISKALTRPGKLAFQKIKKHFGNSIITSSGELDRPFLRQIIFSSPQERLWLENLLHPLIRKEIHKQLFTAPQGPYQVIEIPLLVNRKENYAYLNRVLLVVSDIQEQVKRVMLRDNLTEEVALSILRTQPNYLEEENLVDDLLLNDGTLEQLFQKVEVLHKKYLCFATGLNA